LNSLISSTQGLRKLQLITEARKTCPEVVIVLGEELTRFRDASKLLYSFLRAFSWNDRAERLGFDEVSLCQVLRHEGYVGLIAANIQVWMDISDMVDYNIDVINRSDLQNSFFHLSREDPTVGFAFNATQYAGHTFPQSVIGDSTANDDSSSSLRLRLMLGSQLALHLRHQLEEVYGYTSTVGVSTSKLLSKLVGNTNKPRGQTTLIPPYDLDNTNESSIRAFLDDYEIGKIPYIGHKLAHKMREHILGRPARCDNYDAGFSDSESKELVTVGQVRQVPEMSVEFLNKLLVGPGFAHDSGSRIFALLHGVDDSEVARGRNVPRQISIEDSYLRLDSMDHVVKELKMLASRLIERMRIDLTEARTGDEGDRHSKDDPSAAVRRWIGRPESLRLTTRPRMPINADGTRTRTFKRVSRSSPIPSFVFSLSENAEAVADRLVMEALIPLFKRLHPERRGWDLSLMNVAVTNMIDTASESKGATGRDIESMFKRQNTVLDEFRVKEEESLISTDVVPGGKDKGSMLEEPANGYYEDDAVSDASAEDFVYWCHACDQRMPAFAKVAHERFHDMSR